MYAIFFKFIGLFPSGETKETKGTAFVVYEDIYDAKDAVEHLSGFNVGGRYLVVLYFQVTKYVKLLFIICVELTEMRITRKEKRKLRS